MKAGKNMLPRILAIYLPQFHQIPENDTWWGEGFTEWTAVKAAEPLFEGHEQPNEPLDDNYYDLMDKSTMEWQASLMHQYGVDGMCFYHYYFKDGRKILEKPAENLLKWKDIDMPFCFSWANESWIRSWSAISENEGNQWSQKFDRKTDSEKDSGVLLEQNYGDREDWIKHYGYLSDFFNDSRYIKYNNRPVFVIYKPDNILCLKDMLHCWNQMAIKDGFDGIFSIGTNTRAYKEKGLSCANIQEPQDTINRFFQDKFDNDKGVMKYISYDDVWKKLVYKDIEYGQCLGAFSGYDDSPRREHGATVIYDKNPVTFQKGMSAVIRKAQQNKSPFIFINAWNEWGEGMYLEPDKKYGYGFLEALKNAKKSVSLGEYTIAKTDEYEKTLKNENAELQRQCDRYRTYWATLDRWVSLFENGENIDSILYRHGIKNVLVYGYGILGKHVINEIKDTEILGVIDQRHVVLTRNNINTYTIDNELPKSDLIIVTVMYDFNDIYEKLCKKTDAKIISLYDMLNM